MLHALAEELGNFVEYVGGPAHATSLLAPDRILHAAILPWLLGTNDNARFLASRTQSFSLLEVGLSHGLYALELAARFANGSFVHLEPNGTAWR